MVVYSAIQCCSQAYACYRETLTIETLDFEQCQLSYKKTVKISHA